MQADSAVPLSFIEYRVNWMPIVPHWSGSAQKNHMILLEFSCLGAQTVRDSIRKLAEWTFLVACVQT
jgi:hypothetical protein